MSRSAGTLVDSSVILDVLTEDPRWLGWSEGELKAAAERGALVINAVVVAEIVPRFSRIEALRDALQPTFAIEEIPLEACFLAGHAHAAYRRAGGRRAAVLPDFLIGAHAAVSARPLLTRDPRRVATHLPGVDLICP